MAYGQAVLVLTIYGVESLYTEILGAFMNDQSLTRSPLSVRVGGGGRGRVEGTSASVEVCSLPEILLLSDIKERVEVEHVEADLVQGLEQKCLGQLQLVKPIGNNYHLVRDLLYTESEKKKHLTGKATAVWLCGTVQLRG